MKRELIRTSPDKEKAQSILNMVNETLRMIETIDHEKFTSNVVKNYYDVIRELESALILLEGYKTTGEGAHKRLIEYIEQNYEQFERHEISLMDDLRVIRNRIVYDGFFVEYAYLNRNIQNILEIINKLKGLIKNKLSQK